MTKRLVDCFFKVDLHHHNQETKSLGKTLPEIAAFCLVSG